MPVKSQIPKSAIFGRRLKEKSAFQRYLAPLRQTDWVVYAKPPFAGPEQVLDYVGRYTHRVAISNNRILDIHGGKVRFRWKDYRRRGQQKTMTVSAEEFIRRFLIHVPPSNFTDPLLRFPRQSLPCGEAGAVSSAPCHGGTPARRRQRGEGLSGPIRRADRRFALPSPVCNLGRMMPFRTLPPITSAPPSVDTS